ncbi:MAG: glycoside hydrolase family 15 protein [Microbacterium sp.]
MYGEAMDAIHLADARGLPLSHTAWTQVREVIDWVCENWDRPEEGIWETRGG